MDSIVPPPPAPAEYRRQVPRPVPREAKRATDWLYVVAGASVANAVLAAFGSSFGLVVSFELSSIAGALVNKRYVLAALVLGVVLVLAIVMLIIAGTRIKKGSWGWAIAAAIPLCLDTVLMFSGLPESIP
ncbi:MAG: hypothetical protein JSS65_11790 [Armatimonadetes bacterium]|nr:hypothetical protein [Armatimonadota bacterium]